MLCVRNKPRAGSVLSTMGGPAATLRASPRAGVHPIAWPLTVRCLPLVLCGQRWAHSRPQASTQGERFCVQPHLGTGAGAVAWEALWGPCGVLPPASSHCVTSHQETWPGRWRPELPSHPFPRDHDYGWGCLPPAPAFAPCAGSVPGAPRSSPAQLSCGRWGLWPPVVAVFCHVLAGRSVGSQAATSHLRIKIAQSRPLCGTLVVLRAPGLGARV